MPPILLAKIATPALNTDDYGTYRGRVKGEGKKATL
jgi:hypothetical protein